jgi:hypothetical protein
MSKLDLSSVKAGDMVWISGRRLPIETRVDRTTKTQIICATLRYHKKDGYQIGVLGIWVGRIISEKYARELIAEDNLRHRRTFIAQSLRSFGVDQESIVRMRAGQGEWVEG